ncbi:queuosine salvage family protein [Thermodesulfobacteriota bacterium]
MWNVIETARYVAQESSLVQFNTRAVDKFCKSLLYKGLNIPPWDSIHHFNERSEDAVTYFLILDSINFCFWPPPGKKRWEIQHNSNRLSGYYAMAVSLKRALESGLPINKAGFLANMSLNDLIYILSGQGELQLLEKRLQILHELGDILLKEYEGKAHRLIESAGKSAIKLVNVLLEKMPSFRDIAQYKGKTIYFFKRAQILAADLNGFFAGRSWGTFNDMEKLTAFADYKLPQVLRHLGILCYSEPLSEKVDKRVMLESGSPEEVEIRANTIWAVEQIKKNLFLLGKEVNSYAIDWLLWNLGQDDSFRKKPYHLTASIYY